MTLSNLLRCGTCAIAFLAGSAGLALSQSTNQSGIVNPVEIHKKAVDKANQTKAAAEQSADALAGQAAQHGERRMESATAGAEADLENANQRANRANEKIEQGKVHQLEGRWEKTSFKYDRPDITVYDAETSIPTVHIAMKTRTFSFHHPGFCTRKTPPVWQTKTEWVNKKIGFGIKTKVPVVTGWWASTTISVPCMKRAEFKTDVPEFKAGTTTVRVPQVKVAWNTVEASFHTWKITDRNWQDELEQAGADAEATKARLDQKIGGIKAEELASFKAEATAEINRHFDVAAANLAKELVRALSVFDAPFAAMQRNRAQVAQQITAAKGDPAQVVAQIDAAIAQIERTKKELDKRFAETLAKLESDHKATLERALGSAALTAQNGAPATALSKS